MRLNIYVLAAIWIISHKCVVSKTIQLYREQVSPHLGGKIPDSAFHTDRLALNQLQKNGIAIPDGVILEQRNPEVYQYTHKTKRPVFKVAATNDRRHTPKEGRYKTANTFETTYAIPQTTQLKEHDLINRPTQKQLAIPHSFRKGHQRTVAINNVHPRISL
ncbi:hypothetical protein HA402_015637 [Bradysia odoriphaga]|nr:hypothetical protein HA402_015637 [Bradysia odoriphaga]